MTFEYFEWLSLIRNVFANGFQNVKYILVIKHLWIFTYVGKSVFYVSISRELNSFKPDTQFYCTDIWL